MLAMVASTSSGVWPVFSALAAARVVSRAVNVAPGRTLLTVMPSAATSLAQVLAQLATAPRTVLDTPNPASGAFTEVLMTLTMRPHCARFMPGYTAFAKAWLLIKCCRKVASNGDGPAGGPAAVVHEDVHVALGHHGSGGGRHFVRVHEVCHGHLVPASGKRIQRRFEAALVAGHQGDGGAQAGQLLCRSEANSLRGSANQGVASAQIQGQNVGLCHAAKGRPVLTLPA